MYAYKHTYKHYIDIRTWFDDPQATYVCMHTNNYIQVRHRRTWFGHPQATYVCMHTNNYIQVRHRHTYLIWPSASLCSWPPAKALWKGPTCGYVHVCVYVCILHTHDPQQKLSGRSNLRVCTCMYVCICVRMYVYYTLITPSPSSLAAGMCMYMCVYVYVACTTHTQHT